MSGSHRLAATCGNSCAARQAALRRAR